MALGQVVAIPASGHVELQLSGVGGGHLYPAISILNPNDGIVYIARNRDCLSNQINSWDWKIPSQSYALLPGLDGFTSVGMFYLDQSGAGHQGEISVYTSNQTIDIPIFQSIGRALQSQATALDVTEGAQPANPGSGILRLWASGSDFLHLLNGAGVDAVIIDSLTALGGVLTGALPNPGLAAQVVAAANIVNNTITAAQIVNNTIGNSQLAGGAALANIGIGGMSAQYLQDGTVDNADLAAGVAFANLAQGQIVQTLTSQLASDTYNNSGMAGEASAGLTPSVNLPETGDILVVTYKGNYLVSGPSTANQTWGWDFFLDGVLATAGYGPRVIIGTSGHVSVCETLIFTGLAAGNHTLNPFMFCTAAQTAGVFMRASSVPSFEHLTIYAQVFRR